jgi:hypothetical protein
MTPRAYPATPFAVAAIAWFAVACGRGGGGAAGRDAVPPPADAAIDARVWTEADVAAAAYHSAAEVAADGVNAKGKLAVLRVRPGGMRREDITAHPCEDAGMVQRIYLGITPETRDGIRAMSHDRETPCPRVLVKVLSVSSTGFTGYRADDGSWQTREDPARVISTETLAVFDVAPRPAAKAPAGADFATLTDALLGPQNGGAVVSVRLQRSSYTGGSAVGMYACDKHDFDGPVWFNSEALGGELGLMRGCRTVTFRTRARADLDWGDSISAELIRIEPVPGPMPDPGAAP